MQIPIIVGEDPTIRRAVELARRLAATTHPIFIAGEPGTGREHLTRFLHARGPRAVAPLSILDCGAAVRGAFDDQLQRVASAAGTLLIRDCDSLDKEQTGAVAAALGRAGAPRVVLTASSGDIEQPALAERLGALSLYVPPLRIRRCDIPALVAHFSETWRREHAARTATFSAAATLGLWRYQWPQNVRELRDEVYAALERSGDGAVDAMHLPARFFPGPRRADAFISGGGTTVIPTRRHGARVLFA